jgi:hypothetical protein
MVVHTEAVLRHMTVIPDAEVWKFGTGNLCGTQEGDLKAAQH